MMCANNPVHYGLMVVWGHLHITLPHYHHYADISEGMELLKCLSDIFFLVCVSKIRSVPSTIFRAIYGTDYENTCIWSNYHHQIGSMTHLPLFRVRSWNNDMRCMSFHILAGNNVEHFEDVPFNPLRAGFVNSILGGIRVCQQHYGRTSKLVFMKNSGQFGYDIGNNLEHFEDIAYNPLDPGSIYVFVGPVLASNITEKRVHGSSWNFHEISETTQQNNHPDCFSPDETASRSPN